MSNTLTDSLRSAFEAKVAMQVPKHLIIAFALANWARLTPIQQSAVRSWQTEAGS